jgi:aminoglycoside phosphotransferase (APT) family kinase protein
MNTATAAGAANINRKIGSSSGTEYPARVPIHMLTSAATNQIGMKTLAAVTIELVPVPPNPAPCKNGQTEQHEASHYDHDRAHLSFPLSEVETPVRDAQRYAAEPLSESESSIV